MALIASLRTISARWICLRKLDLILNYIGQTMKPYTEHRPWRESRL